MQALVDQMQSKIKSYKKQIEEAEEIAALNLAKYRQVQGNVCLLWREQTLVNNLLPDLKQEQEAALLDLPKNVKKDYENDLKRHGLEKFY